MPELPEVETMARDLEAGLRGASVATVQVIRSDVLRHVTARALRERLRGATLERVTRRAKSAVLRFGGPRGNYNLVVTPRFTGALLIDGEPNDAYTCLRLDLTDGRVLRYHDVRRLGTVALFDDAGFDAWSAALGPEPLDAELTAERFSGIIRGSKSAVKTILMDQRRLAGVGNIYANEALWRARIRPARRGTAVTRAESRTLFTHLRELLQEAIDQRGTSFRDYRDTRGERGAYLELLRVYGRAGQPCARCGTTLKGTHSIAGRQTVWCPSCQK